MVFTGKIKSVDLNETHGDVVVFGGHMLDRHYEVEVRGHGIGEVLIGQYGLNKDDIQITIGNGGDL